MRLVLILLFSLALIAWRVLLTLLTTPVNWCRWVDTQVEKLLDKLT